LRAMFKKEIIFGVTGALLVIVLTIFYGFQYKVWSGRELQGVNPTTTTPGNNPITDQVTLSLAEVEKHNSSADCWVIIKDSVYNVTGYLSSHPGGSGRISTYCGRDLTNAFLSQSHSPMADRLRSSMLLGPLNAKATIQKVRGTQSIPSDSMNNGLTGGNRRGLEYEDD